MHSTIAFKLSNLEMVCIYIVLAPSATTNWDTLSSSNEMFHSGDFYANKVFICSYDPVNSLSLNSFDRTTGAYYNLTISKNATFLRSCIASAIDVRAKVVFDSLTSSQTLSTFFISSLCLNK